MKMILFFVLPFLFLLGIFIFWAKSRFLSPLQLPKDQILISETALRQTAPLSPDELKVLTWNIGYASGALNNVGKMDSKDDVVKNLNEMVHSIKTLDPDLIFLQEVDFKAKRTFGINQLEFLQKELNMPYAAYRVLWNKRYVPFPYWPVSLHFGPVASGQVVLSRYKIKSQQIEDLPMPPHAFWYNWFYLDRVVQKLTLDWQGQVLSLWNVHHEAFHAKTRGQHVKILAKSYAQDQSQYKILAGDFNDPTTQPLHSYSDSRFQNTLDLLEDATGTLSDNQAFPEAAKTFPSFSLQDKLDHILISKSLAFKDRKIVCAKASDHCLVFAKIGKNND
jgi:endonuclease/exonuclease/phosphatase family metal-dependent hydrolase